MTLNILQLIFVFRLIQRYHTGLFYFNNDDGCLSLQGGGSHINPTTMMTASPFEGVLFLFLQQRRLPPSPTNDDGMTAFPHFLCAGGEYFDQYCFADPSRLRGELVSELVSYVYIITWPYHDGRQQQRLG